MSEQYMQLQQQGASLAEIFLQQGARLMEIQASAGRALLRTHARSCAAIGAPDWSALYGPETERQFSELLRTSAGAESKSHASDQPDASQTAASDQSPDCATDGGADRTSSHQHAADWSERGAKRRRSSAHGPAGGGRCSAGFLRPGRRPLQTHGRAESSEPIVRFDAGRFGRPFARE